ncbi:MAG: Asp-tRNA(Asn)/Glu-tRNA(Gln) amidotransferase subunit GatB [Anaerolineae bacterium]|jgi:aspartyl-tRNA(Asn)/glutamyl-tRNA(Gln) amidotransferase subunit B|nr:Asp-tRNA(Asn)/Glu-tRNA(Gln) amidotransferase subunit GatB [Anaerolineae bacterium]
MTTYETIIGLEVHAQILTQSKMFCGCSADYASTPPNTHVCPVCMALPGVLPVINRVAVEKTILAGLALSCAIGPAAVFARKNYHYADLPKGYQISQYELPLCHGGWIEVEIKAEGKVKRIGITRAHLEEDTGKLIHTGDASLVDLNRAGVPLLEIVTEPDLRSADEAHAYLTQLQRILRYLGVSTADMEKGAMRCEANVSVRPVGAEKFGTKVEVKNLNSFRAVKESLDYEVARQIALLESGGRVVQVTMGWDDERGRTVVQRTKETADDYRYFPEPDLPPLVIEPAWAEAIRMRLPELPDAKVARFIRQWGLDLKEARVLAEERPVAEYFEAVVEAVTTSVVEPQTAKAVTTEPKTVANWVTGELFRLLNAAGVGIEAVKITPTAFAELLELVNAGQLNLNSAKKVFGVMFETGRRAPEIVRDLGLAQVSDADALTDAVKQALAKYPTEVARYRGGEEKLFGWLMGQVMRETRGKGNPAVMKELLTKALSSDS